MGETVLGRLLRQRGIPWGTLLRWLPRAPRVAKLVSRLAADRRVSGWSKALLALIPIYVLVPVDLVPELLTGPLGLTDDLAVALLLFRQFLQSVPPAVLAEHLTDLRLDP
jgi:uncharacterized membrane protein YkvA (DUF1232 family)